MFILQLAFLFSYFAFLFLKEVLENVSLFHCHDTWSKPAYQAETMVLEEVV